MEEIIDAHYLSVIIVRFVSSVNMRTYFVPMQMCSLLLLSRITVLHT